MFLAGYHERGFLMKKTFLFLMLVIFSALEQEIGEYKKTARFKKAEVASGFRAWEGKPAGREVLLVLTGEGKTNAVQAAVRVFDKYPVSCVISTGFGGGLNQKTRVGDVVVYQSLKQGEMEGLPGVRQEKVTCNPGLVEKAMQIAPDTGLRVLKGEGLTLDRVCSAAAAKRNLGLKYRADIVDMESYWLGRNSAEKGVPFIAVRSIFDAVEDDLALLETIAAGGKLAPAKVLWRAVSRPSCIGELAAYSRAFRQAAKNLAIYLDALVKNI